METREVHYTEVHVYKLILNNMTWDHIEDAEIVAISTDYQRLVDWYNEQLNPGGMWRDGRWGKAFKEGSPLEWYNPAPTEFNFPGGFNQGIRDEWVSEAKFRIARERYIFVE